LKVNNILVIPSLLRGCEIWTLRQRIIRRLKAAQMKFMRPKAGFNLLEHKRSEHVSEFNILNKNC
jgi:hypothetical protein